MAFIDRMMIGSEVIYPKGNYGYLEKDWGRVTIFVGTSAGTSDFKSEIEPLFEMVSGVGVAYVLCW